MSGKKITELISGSIDSLPLSGVTAIIYSGTTFQHNLTHLRQTLVDSGSHHFTGSQNVNGSLIVSGTGSIMNYLSVGKYGNPHVDGPESLRVENSSSINVARFYGDHQNYTQINLTNKNSGSNASGDIVITADNGNESVHFIDLGINSSTYQGGFVGRENDAYLLNVGKDMYIGTIGGVNHPSKLFLFGQNSWENPQITISGSGQVSFNTCSCEPGFTYQFSGSAKLQNELKVDGSVTASYFVGDGSQLTNLPTQTTDVSMFLSSSTFETFTSSYTSESSSFDSRILAATNEQDLSNLATTGSNTFVDNQIITGSLNVSNGITGSLEGTSSFATNALSASYAPQDPLPSGLVSGSSQISYTGITDVPSDMRFSDTWTVTPGTSNYSFTVEDNNTYQLWILGNIPNGIITYNATISISNSNVPVLGSQFAWNYTGAGDPILLTSLPDQIIGTSGVISTSIPVVGTNTNTFTFGIQNNTSSDITVNYGYLKIS